MGLNGAGGYRVPARAEPAQLGTHRRPSSGGRLFGHGRLRRGQHSLHNAGGDLNAAAMARKRFRLRRDPDAANSLAAQIARAPGLPIAQIHSSARPRYVKRHRDRPGTQIPNSRKGNRQNSKCDQRTRHHPAQPNGTISARRYRPEAPLQVAETVFRAGAGSYGLGLGSCMNEAMLPTVARPQMACNGGDSPQSERLRSLPEPFSL